MASVPAPKKSWVFDGTIEQYPDDYLTSTHGAARTCIACHGGDATASTRALAHTAGFQAVPDALSCGPCHTPIGDSAKGGLHAHLGGYVMALEARGVNMTPGTVARDRYDAKCLDCHISDEATGEARCGHCHISVPRVAQHGFLNGHNFRKTPDMERNCTACHGSRIKDEFYGLNGDLITRNGLGLPAPVADVHFARTQTLNADGLPYGCTFCHSGDELHGVGSPAEGAGSRYDVTTAPTCTDTGCHDAVQGSNSHHTDEHLNTMTCYICHAQPYKQCFGCHLDLDAGTGLPFYAVNEGDPTLASRPGGTADSLISFRIGKNPLPTKLNPLTMTAYEYTLLRHPPIDADLFRYSGINEVTGLVPDVYLLPTWKFATPHSIRPLTASGTPHLDPSVCDDCHDAGYVNFWLTDPLLNDEGWLEAAYEADEALPGNNTEVVVDMEIPGGP